MELLAPDFELMCKTIFTQMHLVERLLSDGNNVEELYDEVESNEIIIDRIEIKIREEVVFTIFKFNPTATDLRRIVSYQDATTNLERIGDGLLNITRFLQKAECQLPYLVEIYKKIVKMSHSVSLILKNSVLSFINEDSTVAYQAIKSDHKIDAYYREISEIMQEVFSQKN